MAKRLQVIIQEGDYRAIQRIARSRRMTIAEWVRQALHLARRQEPTESVSSKLKAVRAAVKHSYPTADIGQMLAEIETGYDRGL